jgi:GT2 family glycosyltransferase
MDTKLGIIIPTYDSLNTLKALIRGIYCHTFGAYVIYVVEDGQKQETIDWLRTQKVTLIENKKNCGVAKSWNKGIKRALKEGCTHFAILNDDIEVPANWWEKCEEKFKEANLVTVKSDIQHTIISGWFFILDKKCIDKVGLFDEQFAPCFFEDVDYGIRFKNSRLKGAIVDIDVFHHGGMTTYGKLKKESKISFDENFKRFKKKYPNIRIRV